MAALDTLRRLGLDRELGQQLLAKKMGASAAVTWFGDADWARTWTTVLDLYGARLLSGSKPEARQVRLAISERLSSDKTRGLARLGKEAYELAAASPSPEELTRLAERRWTDGGAWAMAFVAAAGLPACFAGAGAKAPGAGLDFRPPPTLKPFQAALAERLHATLCGRTRHRRVILSLPTGGGKTRTAGEALLRLVAEQYREPTPRYYLWLAQSEELCDQATLCLQQLWAHALPGEPIAVHRYYGGRDIAAAAFRPGVVVATIQQVSARLRARGPVEHALLAHLRAIIVDEAHRATSVSYANLFAAVAEVNPLRERLPVGGLTATPGRARGETNDLIRVFGQALLTPHFDDGDAGGHPLETFRSRGYLARPEHELVATRYHVRTPEPLSRAAHEWQTFAAEVSRELGRAQRRNQLIVERLLRLPEGTPTLVYACSVEHVTLLHALLSRAGRSSAYLMGNTPRPDRLATVGAFRAGQLDFLVNYGVLTTGFDAPKTSCVAITRPITSEVLYEQIVGRGLRGEAFGGTARCLILDFEDNFKQFGDQLAYHRFTRFWESARRVDMDVDALPPPKVRRGRKRVAEGPGLF